MKFYDTKNNKIYNNFEQIPSESKARSQKLSIYQLYQQFDKKYNFKYKGRQLSAKQIHKLNHQTTLQACTVIISHKPVIKKFQESQKKVSYQTYRSQIQNYISKTKTNQKQKIRQNAEFIFQNAIDGNFKYHTFDYFDLEREFTQERKKQLLNEVFLEICKDKTNDIKMKERVKKEAAKEDKNARKKSEKDKLSAIKEKKQESDQQDNQNKVEQDKNPDQDQKMILQLHELQYITENAKQLICINKQLLKTNLDNPTYEDIQKMKSDAEILMPREQDQRRAKNKKIEAMYDNEESKEKQYEI